MSKINCIKARNSNNHSKHYLVSLLKNVAKSFLFLYNNNEQLKRKFVYSLILFIEIISKVVENGKFIRGKNTFWHDLWRKHNNILSHQLVNSRGGFQSDELARKHRHYYIRH